MPDKEPADLDPTVANDQNGSGNRTTRGLHQERGHPQLAESRRVPGHRMNRAQLVGAYFRSGGVLRAIVAVLWLAILIALLGLFVLYGYAKAITAGYQWIVAPFVVLFLIWMLFVAEGAELATAALLDKDPDQLDDPHGRSMLRRIQEDESAFLNGRQAIAVSTIVIVTLVVSQITSVNGLDTKSDYLPSRLNDLLNSPVVQGAFVFGFANFTILWLAQLYPKLLATNAPQVRFSIESHQRLIATAITLGRYTNIGAPTSVIAMLAKRVPLRGKSTAALLRPSRRDMFRSQCNFVYGMGLLSARRDLMIDEDGSVVIEAKSERVIATEGVTELHTFESWSAAIWPDTVTFNVSGYPANNVAVPSTHLSLAEFEGKAIPDGKLELRVEFPVALSAGIKLGETFRYTTKPGAMSEEFYFVQVSHPIQRLELTVRPRDESRRCFIKGKCTVEGSDQYNQLLSQREESRIRLETYKGGYRAQVEYPLVGSRIRLSWQSRQRPT